jgi:flavorubredoxin
LTEVKLAEGVYWVGAIDWNLGFCGSYSTPRGTTYNAYLVVDEKIALVDTVKKGFEQEMLKRIKEIAEPAEIDYMICNHSEMDHSGGIPDIMKRANNARLVASPKGKIGLQKHYNKDWDAVAVRTGDELNLGRKSLIFIEAPMLHWPDNMFTYLKEDRILMSNDAFGQHIATNQRFEDEVGWAVMEEAAKYFAVIISPYSPLVQKKIEEMEKMRIGIDMIAPAHGVIWRQPAKIIEAYRRWSGGEAELKVTVVFDTMWGSTDRMAREIARGVASEGVKVKVFNLRNSDSSEIVRDLLESRAIAVGSPTLNANIYPTVGGFLTFLKGIRLRNMKAAVFGSYGWGGGSIQLMKEELKKAGADVIEEELSVQYVPTEEDLKRCFEFGKIIAEKIKF